MRKSCRTEGQIIGMMKEQEADFPTSELCRKQGLSPTSFYTLTARYDGTDLAASNRQKQLRGENAKSKRLLVDAMLDNVGLTELPGAPLRRRCSGRTRCCGRCGITGSPNAGPAF